MTTKTAMAAAAMAMALSASAAAEEFWEPRAEATVYASHVTAKYDTLEDAGIDKPKGFGAGLRFSGYFTENGEIYGEVQQNELDVDAAGIDFDARARQLRLGLRGTLLSDAANSPAYLKLSAEYLHVDLKLTASGFTGSGEDSEDLPMAHVRAGGNNGVIDGYLQGGYGANGDFSVLEGLAGVSYSFTKSLAASLEYRYSALDLSDVDEKAKYSDIRVGITSKF